MDTQTLPPYLTAAEAAKALQRSPATMVYLLASGKCPGAYKQGRVWMIPREDILVLLDDDEKKGITRSGGTGRPVTTGTGVMRKDRGGPGGSPKPKTGRPPGRPKKTT